jgi:hypothetical protein
MSFAKIKTYVKAHPLESGVAGAAAVYVGACAYQAWQGTRSGSSYNLVLNGTTYTKFGPAFLALLKSPSTVFAKSA